MVDPYSAVKAELRAVLITVMVDPLISLVGKQFHCSTFIHTVHPSLHSSSNNGEKVTF